MLGVLRRNPQFRTLWYAQLVSGAGDWLNRVALLTLIGELSGSRAAVGVGALFGIELAVRLLPTTLMGPLAGPVADRLPRRMLMIVADLLRMLIVLCFLFVRHPGQVGLLYTLLALQMGVAIFFDSARSGALPSTVSKEDLHTALTLSAATWSAMLTLGAAAGGLLVASFGTSTVFIVDAASYLLSAVLLLRLSLPPTPSHPHAFRWRDIFTFQDMRQGLHHIRSLGLVPILGTKAMWWPAGGFLVMLSVVGHDRFGESTREAGLATGVLFGARGLGTGLGPILARWRMGSGDAELRRQIRLGFHVAAVGYAFFAVAPNLVLASTAVCAAHMGGSTIWVASTTLWQRHVHDAFRGRVFALEFLGMTLSFAVGGLLAGSLYDRTGSIRTTIWSLCGVLVVMAALWSRAEARSATQDTPAQT
jgi:MFS family permease